MAESELDFDPEELAMLRQLFRAEAQDGLETMTARVLAGGSARPTAETLTEMMRVTHTLKGAAGTVGLPAMVDLAHRLESVLAALGRDAAQWQPATGEQLVEITDGLRAYLDESDADGTGAAAQRIGGLIDRLAQRDRGGDSIPPPLRARRPSTAGAGGGAGDARLPDDPLGAGAGRASGHGDSIPPPLLAERTEQAAQAARAELLADPLGTLARGSVTETLVDPPTEGIAGHEPKTWVRVEPQRIDDLMSNAGELLFDRTRIERRVQLLRTLARDLARTRQTLHDALGGPGMPTRSILIATENDLAGQSAVLSQTTAHLLDEIEALRRTIGELQRGLVRIRMESARRLMAHAARTLRALRRATGLRVELRALGEETEFDKAVAEQLVDPVTQLLRNAVAHGVEPPAERAARGKPPTAVITIRARQDGNLLVLEVSDDGRGIDTAALRERLVDTGQWSAARARLAGDQEVLDALLDTGVSIRGDADELAGRGIGIGIVRETVARLGGEVTISSQPGRGTTFALRLPLSTALAQAMLFKVGGQVYALPQVHVAETTSVEGSAVTAQVRHEELPILRLEHLLGHGSPSERRPALVVSFGGKSLVCTVDRIVGSREIIVKPLGPLLAPLTLYAGATISGSGKIQLILDPAQLVRRAYPNAPAAEIADSGSAPLVLAGRALVVDDSRAIREAMTSMLGREGWIVDVAEDGTHALEMTRQSRYDLVVTDLEMPELGGFELIARLRRDARFETTPIVIITSRVSPEHRRRARELGVRALVAKPITRRKLLEALSAR
jgi:chemosensory pili system protein ChpA (sensor histidine kinase/response regulator)